MGVAPATLAGFAWRLVSGPGHGWILMLGVVQWLAFSLGSRVDFAYERYADE